ncbi:hypothetical protein [Carboxylicivirga taeanensis]
MRFGSAQFGKYVRLISPYDAMRQAVVTYLLVKYLQIDFGRPPKTKA